MVWTRTTVAEIATVQIIRKRSQITTTPLHWKHRLSYRCFVGETPTIQRKLKDNGSSQATIDTDENRAYFLIDIPCHPDFVEDGLSNVVYNIKLGENKQLEQNLSNVVSNVMSNVVGANFEHIFKVFTTLQRETSLTELMAMFEQRNRDRFKRTSVDILIQTGLATPTVIDKPKSRNQ